MTSIKEKNGLVWVWRHFTLDPNVQDFDSPLRFTCLLCEASVTHLAGESRLADHLDKNHEGNGLFGGLGEPFTQSSETWKRFSDMAETESGVKAFFEPMKKVSTDTIRVQTC